MKFNPGLKIGQEITNSDIVDIFKCGNMGGIKLLEKGLLLTLRMALLLRTLQRRDENSLIIRSA